MEKKVLVAVAAALMSSAGALHTESARAADADGSAFKDSTVDASLDRGEERVSAQADSQTRLADLRYAYFIGYNARAREDSKSYANLGDEVKHRQAQVDTPAAPATPAAPKPVAEHAAPAKRGIVQAAPLKQVSEPVAPTKQAPAPVAAPKRVIATHVVPSRQVVAQAEPVPLKHVPMQAEPATARHVPAPVESAALRHLPGPAEPAALKHTPVQVAAVPSKHAAAPLPATPLRQASVQVAMPKRVEAQPVHVKLASAQSSPPPLPRAESEPPILIPTQAVTSLPDEKLDDKTASDDDTQVTPRHDSRNAQRAAAQSRQDDDQPQYAEDQPVQAVPARPVRRYQNQQQYATAPAYSEESGGYAGRQYAPPPPPPPRSIQASQYAPAQYPPGRYQQADTQSAYVPRPPAQAAQQVIVVARPPAYSSYNDMYTPPELRRPNPAAYGNPPQPTGYQGWE